MQRSHAFLSSMTGNVVFAPRSVEVAHSEALAADLIHGLSRRDPRPWLLAYAAVSAVTLASMWFGASHIRIGPANDGFSLADYHTLVRLILLGLTAFWATLMPLSGHFAARRIGGTGRLKMDLLVSAFVGIPSISFWCLGWILVLRVNAVGFLLFCLVAVAGAYWTALLSVHHGLRGWRGAAFQFSQFGLAVLLPISYVCLPPVVLGYPRSLQRAMTRASVPAAHEHNLAPQDNAAIAYSVAGWKPDRRTMWFLEGAKRDFADFMPEAHRISRASTPNLREELATAEAVIEEAAELHRRRDYAGAAARFGAVLSFTRHLASERNNIIFFHSVRMVVLAEVFEPLGRFIADPSVPFEQLKALHPVLHRAKVSRATAANAIDNSYRLDDSSRRAYAGQHLLNFYAPGVRAAVGNELNLLLLADSAAARQAVEAVDSAPIVEHAAMRDRLLSGALSGGGPARAFDCIWDPGSLARCAYLSTPSHDLKDMPALFAMAEARLRVLYTATGLRLGLGMPRRGAEDPFAPGQTLRLVRRPDGSGRLYSVGPDRADQGGQTVPFDRNHWSTVPGGDISLDFPAAPVPNASRRPPPV